MNRSEALIILDLKDGMTLKEISVQRNFLLQCFHPDKHNNLDAKSKAEAKTKKILEAYEYLKNNINEKTNSNRDFFNNTSRYASSGFNKIKTVKEFCNLDEDKFFNMLCNEESNNRGEYIRACHDFYQRVRLWDYSKLSKKQQEWLVKICIMVYEYDDR